MLRYLYFLILATLVLHACSQKSQRTVTASQAGTATYPLVISFISYGSGIDYKQLEKLDSLIKSFDKCTLQVEKKSWGREGEIDYCFSAPNSNCLNQWKELLSKSLTIKDRVQMTENRKCGEGH